MERDVSKFLLKLRKSHPFLASLSLFAEYLFTDNVDMFSTNGRTILLEPDYFHDLDENEKSGVLLHLVLHCALLHCVRIRHRDPLIWNHASDIVVNNIILEGGTFPPPLDTAVDQRHRGKSVEEVYEYLLSSEPGSADGDDSDEVTGGESQHSSGGTEAVEGSGEVDFHPDLESPNEDDSSLTQQDGKKLESHWRGAMQRATTAEQLSLGGGRGDLPEGLQREIDAMRAPQLDWRTHLWRFLVRTPNDYAGFDRRFVHAGLYLDELQGESLFIDLVLDTSGSIDDLELADFLNEVKAIIRAYDHIQANIYYVDAEVHGPYPISKHKKPAIPVGGGGTDFSTFFSATEGIDNKLNPPLCIYFTDGDGYFPAKRPKRQVLWVVTTGGMPDNYFPFGEVARLERLY